MECKSCLASQSIVFFGIFFAADQFCKKKIPKLHELVIGHSIAFEIIFFVLFVRQKESTLPWLLISFVGYYAYDLFLCLFFLTGQWWTIMLDIVVIMDIFQVLGFPGICERYLLLPFFLACLICTLRMDQDLAYPSFRGWGKMACPNLQDWKRSPTVSCGILAITIIFLFQFDKTARYSLFVADPLVLAILAIFLPFHLWKMHEKNIFEPSE